jgi:hypothetical protein
MARLSGAQVPDLGLVHPPALHERSAQRVHRLGPPRLSESPQLVRTSPIDRRRRRTIPPNAQSDTGPRIIGSRHRRPLPRQLLRFLGYPAGLQHLAHRGVQRRPVLIETNERVVAVIDKP